MEPTPKKGLSKGCLVTLIIVGVLLVMVIIAGVTCWYYKDDLAKTAAATAIEQVKVMVAENPPDVVDTAQFNALADGFVIKLKEEELDYEKYAGFMQAIQGIINDKAISSEEAERLRTAMVEYFPDLADIALTEEPVDSMQVEDSIISH